MRKILYFIIILLFSCSNYAEKSFVDISNALHSWNQKYNFKYTATYLSDYGTLVKEKSIEQINSDLRRFEMEIGRIENKKLSKKYSFTHAVLENYLNNLIYDFDVLNNNTWNLLESVNQFHRELLLLHALFESSNEYGNIINEQLEIMSDNIFYLIENIIYFDVEQKKHSLSVLDEIDIISSNFIIKDKNENFYKSLSVLRNWLKNDYSNLNKLSFDEIRYDLDKNARHQFGSNYSIDNIREIAEKQILSIQIEMFDLSLPIYLLSNDEPVWLDYNDTLDVIKWSLNSLEKEVVPKTKILSTTYKIYNDLMSSFIENGIPVSEKTKKILFSPIFVENLNYFDFLYVPYKKINSAENRIKCFINTYSMYSDNSRNYFDIYLEVIESVMYSDIYFLHNELSEDYMIPLAYNDDLFLYGWKDYSKLYYLEKKIKDPNYPNLKLAYLKNRLNNVLNTISCIDYYNNSSSLESIKSYMKKNLFLNDIETHNNIYLILSNGSKIMREFIGFNELVNLSYEYNNSEISDVFINKIIDNKVFSLKMIKENFVE